MVNGVTMTQTDHLHSLGYFPGHIVRRLPISLKRQTLTPYHSMPFGSSTRRCKLKRNMVMGGSIVRILFAILCTAAETMM